MDRSIQRTLICTADTRTWPAEDRPLLFLGEWCLLHALKAEWERRDYRIVPYHWSDVERRHADYRRLDALFEQLFLQLAEILNDIHGTYHSLRYWRIVVGPWLRYFIGIMYDRFRALECALDTGLVECVPVISCSRWQQVPRNHADFFHEALSDHGNQHIFRIICEHIAPELVRTVAHEDFVRRNVGGRLRELIGLGAFLVTSGGGALSRRRIVASLGYAKLGELIRLGRKFGQLLPFPIPKLRPREFPIDAAVREKLSFDCERDTFSRLLASTIKEFLPSAYLEGHPSMVRLAKAIYPRSAHLIIDDNALHTNEVFKVWTAEAVENGTKLAIYQHGGFYGSGEWNENEIHERSICDLFLNWGWESTSLAKPMPSYQLVRLKRRTFSPSPEIRRIAWIMTMFPRYAYLQTSMFSPSDILDYIDDQIRFYRALPHEIASQLWLRPYQKDWDWSFINRLYKAGVDIEQICPPRISMIEQLAKCRIGIFSANTTVHLEMFAMGIPTILYWNPKIWRIRQEAEPYYEALRGVGILHDSPESAASWLKKIYKDAWIWWSSAEVQYAVSFHMERFGCTSDNWANEWKSRLSEVDFLPKR